MATKNPFSLYDCLGYFIPGALSVYIAIFLINVENGNFVNAFRSVEFGSVDATIAFVIIAYILGHAVNYASSITVEKYSNWMFGYPSTFLLQEKQVPYYRRVTDEQLLDWIESNPHSQLAWFKKMMFQSKWKKLSLVAHFRLRSSCWRFALLLFIIPIHLFDFCIGKGCGLRLYYRNPETPVMSKLIKGKIDNLLASLNINNENGLDFRRILHHYYYEKFSSHQSKFDNYVALYGFARSLSLVFSLTTTLFFALMIFSSKIGISFASIVFGFFLWILSDIYFMAYMKFSRRYTLEGFMCLISDKDMERVAVAEARDEIVNLN